ncbi:MAG: hypothetical protein DHS20C13_03390 [Thermodesulfobacteriota bacterium]|nr:MAG: hypothetical protein DHS20C13_03390 [Thermodesulfobacteriota bacterium]
MFRILLIRISLAFLCFFLFSPIITHAYEPKPTSVIKSGNTGGKPKQVQVGIYVINIEEVNSAKQSYQATIALDMKWNDPTLICGPSEDKGIIRKFNLKDIWNPSMIIANQEHIEKQFTYQAWVDCLGNVEYTEIVFGDFLTIANIKEFPFDQRPLTIELVSTEFDTSELQFVNDKSITGRDSDLSVADWYIDKVPVAESTAYHFKPGNRELSSFVYTLSAKRNSSFFVWKIIIPLILIVIMSWAVFWIPPSQLGPQIGLSMTSMLTLIAYRFAIGHVVPDVSYLTRFDKFVFGSTLLVFLAFAEAIVSGSLSYENNDKLAKTIDFYSRFIFPAIFICILIYSLFL